MINKSIILTVASITACSLTLNSQTNSDKPNIILIMADDLGWGDTGYNGNPVIRTPHLDSMAKEGIRFDRFYSASAVCSPTRASVLTGRNPYRTGVFHANTGILRPEEITIPELVKEEGYLSGIFGKWHLGTLTKTELDANRGKPGNIEEYNPPALHGFDVAFVTESKVPTYDPMKKPLDRYNIKGWKYLKDGEPYEHYGTYYWDINGEKVTDNLDGDDSRVIMDRVIPFIHHATESKKPFLAVVWFHTPHFPCVAGPEYHEMYKDQSAEMRNYAGCISAMDKQIGRLRAYLKETGNDQNTMIWFCSDNGPENGYPGETGGFRQRKRSLYEGGVRVPGLLVWPEKVKSPVVTDIPFVTTDYLPTIVDVLKINKSKLKNQLDGISMLPLIEGKMNERSDPFALCIHNQVSYTDNNYKLYTINEAFELYDIVNDPFEENDLSQAKPLVLKKMKQDMVDRVESYKHSFQGKEYGKESFERLKQSWSNPFIIR